MRLQLSRQFPQTQRRAKGPEGCSRYSPDQTDYSELTGIAGLQTRCAELEKMSGSTEPVRISGTSMLPRGRCAAVGKEAKAKLEEKKEEIAQKIQDQLKNKLKGLFH